MIRRAVVAISLTVVAAASAAAPQRIVSLNLCADELVLRLAAPGTVKSVTWLARDPVLSNVPALAQAVPVNRGLAEDIVPLAPDLVIAGTYTSRTAVALLQRLRVPVLEIDVPGSIEEALAQIRTVAAALGAEERGAQLVADIQKRLAALPRAAHAFRAADCRRVSAERIDDWPGIDDQRLVESGGPAQSCRRTAHRQLRRTAARSGCWPLSPDLLV